MITSYHGYLFHSVGPFTSTGYQSIPLTKDQLSKNYPVSLLSTPYILNKQPNHQWCETPWHACDFILFAYIFKTSYQNWRLIWRCNGDLLSWIRFSRKQNVYQDGRDDWWMKIFSLKSMPWWRIWCPCICFQTQVIYSINSLTHAH